MKATLKFDLNDSSERLAHKRAVCSTDAYLVLHNIDQELRTKIKYEELTEEVETALMDVRERLFDLLAEYGVDLNDLE